MRQERRTCFAGLFLLPFIGRAAPGATDLIGWGERWRFLKGTAEASAPADLWRYQSFDDSLWESGQAPFHQGEGPGTVLSDMRGRYSCVFLRKSLFISDPHAIQGLRLEVDFDDGICLWINGVELFSLYAPEELRFDAVSDQDHPAGIPEVVLFRDPRDFLTPGENIVAVQVFNESISSRDFFFDMRLRRVTFAAEPRVQPARGLCSEPVTVTLTCPTSGSRIRYTTDGSIPTEEHGQLYTGPLSIDRTTCLRAVAFTPDRSHEPSQTVTHTYFFFDRPTDRFGRLQESYPPAVKKALLTLPLLSIVMDNKDFQAVLENGSGSIGASGGNKMWERPCSLELIYPPRFSDLGGGFQVNCGIRPHSWTGTEKRSFKIVFKKRYGPGRLHYPFFESAPRPYRRAARVFDKIVLRANSNDGWESRWGGSEHALYVRDQFARDLGIDMNGLGSHGTFVHLFVNGQYWGLYNPVERPDHDFLAAYLGGDDSDYFAFNHGGEISGDPTVWRTMHELARNSDLGDLQAYENFSKYLDLPAFCDYLLASFYSTNPAHDWPINAGRPQNFYGGNRIDPPGPVRYFIWDAEFALREKAHVHPNFRADSPYKDRVFIAVWFALLKQPEFRMLFADRAHKHLSEGGALSDAASRERLLLWADFVREGVTVAEKWRWGAEGDWEEELNEALSVIEGNAASLLEDLRSQGYYPGVEPPFMDPRGGIVQEGVRVILQNLSGRGEIYCALGGGDPRTVGGAPAPGARRYSGPIAVTHAMVIKARVYEDGLWSALTEGAFFIPGPLENLRITEIMYHPAGSNDFGDKEFEFIELKNIGNVPVDLTGVQLSGGISFVFPEGQVVMPGGFAVVVSNEQAFQARYGRVPVAGVWSGHLSNCCDRIVLQGPDGSTLVAIDYRDASPWPPEADGLGFSLVAVDLGGASDQANPENWRASSAAGGSPGADDLPGAYVPPLIVRQPADAYVAEGENAVFSVEAQGTPSPNYQWQRDGLPLSGATTAELVVPGASPLDHGSRFRCRVWNLAGEVFSEEVTLHVVSEPLFVRGDANGDSRVNLADAVHLLAVLFLHADERCQKAADANDDGRRDIADAVRLLDFLFRQGEPPRTPFPMCGPDPTQDRLSCGGPPRCP